MKIHTKRHPRLSATPKLQKVVIPKNMLFKRRLFEIITDVDKIHQTNNEKLKKMLLK